MAGQKQAQITEDSHLDNLIKWLKENPDEEHGNILKEKFLQYELHDGAD